MMKGDTVTRLMPQSTTVYIYYMMTTVMVFTQHLLLLLASREQQTVIFQKPFQFDSIHVEARQYANTLLIIILLSSRRIVACGQSVSGFSIVHQPEELESIRWCYLSSLEDADGIQDSFE